MVTIETMIHHSYWILFSKSDLCEIPEAAFEHFRSQIDLGGSVERTLEKFFETTGAKIRMYCLRTKCWIWRYAYELREVVVVVNTIHQHTTYLGHNSGRHGSWLIYRGHTTSAGSTFYGLLVHSLIQPQALKGTLFTILQTSNSLTVLSIVRFLEKTPFVTRKIT